MGSNPIGATNYMFQFIHAHFYIFAFLIGLGIIVGGTAITIILSMIRVLINKLKQAKTMAKAKESETWKMKDGKKVLLTEMSDSHLTNAIKMIVRQQASIISRTPYPTLTLQDFLYQNSHYQKLTKEAKKRKMIITILDTPISKDERKEYVDIYTPIPASKINAGFFPTDWDSRSEE